MDLKFQVSIRIARPVHEVFEAVADPAKLSSYFTTRRRQRADGDGNDRHVGLPRFSRRLPVNVVEVVPDRKIVFRWEAHEVGSAQADQEGPGHQLPDRT